MTKTLKRTFSPGGSSDIAAKESLQSNIGDKSSDSPQHDPQHGMTSASAAVAYAGALPLIAGALLGWARPVDLAPTILGGMAIYGVTLLAFFGGVRWGIAVMMRGGPTFRQLLGAIVPLVLAVSILPSDNVKIQLGILVVAIPILLLDDLRATRRGGGAPAWYLGVRVPLTLMMEFAFLAGLILSLRIM
ncbi:MAG: DUF3429 domain-containing protein [Pseudomonadota bacterium]